jgi:hypothetical protein
MLPESEREDVTEVAGDTDTDPVEVTANVGVRLRLPVPLGEGVRLIDAVLDNVVLGVEVGVAMPGTGSHVGVNLSVLELSPT